MSLFLTSSKLPLNKTEPSAMAEGSVLFKGNFEEVKNNDTVIEAYLGKGINKN